jgi:hypothetical protein
LLLGAVTCQISDSHQNIVLNTEWLKVLYLMGGSILASLLFSRFISINKFSLHATYRNRLIRAYLGASNRERRANPITGFEPTDNLSMFKLQGQKPLHVINMALNLVGSEDLAWQERKAESFTCTAYYTGARRPWIKSDQEPPPTRRLGYRDTEYYGGVTDGPISLGTAMAISGAAASPNMGYNSSPLLTFVMTLFNARLGWWLGNPGIAGSGSMPSYRRSGPEIGLAYLLAEAFGLTTDKTRFVNLSDGGHFDNLGLYEMVRRECRHIVVIDAGCDPQLSLRDLGNAVRKCRIDFGVSIEFTSSLSELVAKRCRWAVGTIKYKSQPPGRLICVKPLILKAKPHDEPADVLSYHAQHHDFPHETTADQFFSESQFESYRKLGLLTATALPDIVG